MTPFEALEVFLEVLEIVGVKSSATFLTALAIVLKALFVFDVVDEVLGDFSDSNLAASTIVLGVVDVVDVIDIEILLSPNLDVVGTTGDLDDFESSENAAAVFAVFSLLTSFSVLTGAEFFPLSSL